MISTLSKHTRTVFTCEEIVALFFRQNLKDPLWINELLVMLPTIVDTITNSNCTDLALVYYLNECAANIPSVQVALERDRELSIKQLDELQQKIYARLFN